MAHELHIYNTLSKKKERFQPHSGNQVTMYACGVTVYDDCHIGHARSLYLFEVFRRFLRLLGYKVTFIRNITDIDDKIINRAQQLNISIEQLVQKTIDSYYRDLENLGIGSADLEPRATEHIVEMIAMIEQLIAKKYAYEVDGDVYFKVRQFKAYGQLSGQSVESMRDGAHVHSGEKKEDPLDFALWKKSKPGEPEYDSPWGKGRPGWHIECSVMSTKYLGQTFDIHAGGRDLVFPHHENEIAQAQAATGKQFARFWMHHGLLTVNSQKMSKSLGNFITIAQFLEQYSADALKIFFLGAHYGSPIDYTQEKIAIAEKNKKEIDRFLAQSESLFLFSKANEQLATDDQKRIGQLTDRFVAALADDFNTSKALAVVFELVNLGSGFVSVDKIDAVRLVRQELVRILGILGISAKNFIDESLRKELLQLLQERQKARAEKNYTRADAIRDELKKRGIILLDTGKSVSVTFAENE